MGGRAALVAVSLVSFSAHGLELKLAATLAGVPESPSPRPPAALVAASGERRAYPEPTQALVVEVTLNAVSKGDRVVRMTPGSQFLMRREDLQELMPFVAAPPAYSIEGDDFAELRAIPKLTATFDEKALTLALKLPPDEMPRQKFDLTDAPPAVDLKARAASAMLNYRLGYAGTDTGSGGNLSLAAEVAAAYGDWIFRNQSFHAHSPGDSTHIRLETQAIRDDRVNLRRLTLGDSVTPGLVLGSGVPFAGITLAKAYQLEPYLNRRPGAGFRGLAEYPSEVDFYVGNTLVLRQRVAPGPFDIQNFSYYGGRRDVRVVIRDAFGRQQTIAYPFYFADQGLAAGLHDYSYQAGWLRGQIGIQSNDYGPFAFSAFHQYGVNDALTVGARTEGTARLVNGGPDVFYRDERLGLFAAHAAASHDRDAGRNGHAFSASHSYQRGEFSTQLVWQGFSPGYAILNNGFQLRLPRRDFSATAGYTSPAAGSFSVGFTRLQLPDEAPARSVTLSYSRSLFAGMNFFAVARRQLSEPRSHEIFLGLQYMPTPTQNVNLTGQRDLGGVRTTSLSWANQLPRGEGFAYSVNVQRQEAPEGVNLILAPRLEWHSRYATMSGEVTRLDGAATRSTGYSLALAGALVSAGGHVMASPPVADAFAIVEITPPIAGVRVYENSQEIGRTDARGRILLPNIGSYSRNYAAIESTDVPMDFSIGQVGRHFSPALRSGLVVPFAVELRRSFTGRFVFRVTGQARPLEYHLVVLTWEGGSVEIPTAKNGEFYAENLPAGRTRGRVTIGQRACEFDLDVPASSETAVNLGEIGTCDVAP
jgi:outer membrane usher protein